jgi:hypothetical protein
MINYSFTDLKQFNSFSLVKNRFKTMLKFLIFELILKIAVQASTTSKMFQTFSAIYKTGWLAAKPVLVPYAG